MTGRRAACRPGGPAARRSRGLDHAAGVLRCAAASAARARRRTRPRTRPATARGSGRSTCSKRTGSPNCTVTFGNWRRFQLRTRSVPGDRGGHDRHAVLERQPPDARPRLAELAAARAAALDVHHDQPAALQDRVGGLERLLVALAAAHGEDAAVRVDDLNRPLEQLRLRHEVHLAAQVHGHEEVVEEREVIRGDDRRAVRGHLVRVDAARAVEEQQVGREHQPDELVHPVRAARGAPARGSRVKCSAGRGSLYTCAFTEPSLPGSRRLRYASRAHARERSRARCHSASSSSRSDSAIAGS